MKKKFLAFATLTSALVSSVVLAQSLSLHEQPSDKAKVVGTVELSAGIIPVYTPPKSEWIKIADPRNGNVGWVRSSDINRAKQGSSVIFSQKIISNGNQQGYHVIQFSSDGSPSMQVQSRPINSAELNQYWHTFRKRMQYEQEAMQRSFETVMRDMNGLFEDQMKIWRQPVPAKQTASKTATPTPVVAR